MNIIKATVKVTGAIAFYAAASAASTYGFLYGASKFAEHQEKKSDKK